MKSEELISKLTEYGADMQAISERFSNDMDLYKTCLNMLFTEESFNNLQKALCEEKYEDAFEAAHTLKGVIGNMALTPMYKKACEIVEELRAGKRDKLEILNEELLHQFEEIKKIFEE